MDILLRCVNLRTKLPAAYVLSAAPESMDYYLNDWEEAKSLLEMRCIQLRDLKEFRERQIAEGTWPTELATPSAEPLKDLVTDSKSVQDQSVIDNQNSANPVGQGTYRKEE